MQGTIRLPSSKSQTLRAILFGTLGCGKTVIKAPLCSPDTQAMINACRSLGGHITQYDNRIEIEGTGGKVLLKVSAIDAGNSGIVLRFIAAVASLASEQLMITGDASACKRPMDDLVEGLRSLKVSATYLQEPNFAPLSIRGPMKSGIVRLVGQDSQPVSGLLIASAFSKEKVSIEVSDPGEKPWVGMTLNWLDRLGISYQNSDFRTYQVSGNTQYKGFEYTVPGDLSSAAFPLIASLITEGELTLFNANMEDCQGDKQLIPTLIKMGAKINVDPLKHTLHVPKQKCSFQGSSIDLNDFIDGIAALAVFACFAEGVTHLTNAKIARTKESDRIHCLAKELKKMGAEIIEHGDGLEIRQSKLFGANVDSHGDHRLGMALIVAALGASGETSISNVSCIAKTFPSFIKELQRLGANVTLCN